MQSEFQYPFPLLIIAGKGGVGKTVLTAALGTETAAHGHSTLVVELGGQRQLIGMLADDPKSLPEPDENGLVMLAESFGWESISPDRLLAGWLSGRSMGLIADRLERSGALSVIATSIPGIQDVLTVGYLRALVDEGRWDRIIVDGPASGRARELLRAPRMVAEAATEGPVFDQATRAHQLLTNHEAAAILLVTVPEETPVNETIETAFDVEDDPGIHLAGVVVNRLFPHAEPPKSFDSHNLGPATRARHDTNVAQMKRLAEELPVPMQSTVENPHGIVTPSHIGELLSGELEPANDDGSSVAIPASSVKALEDALSKDIVVTVGTGGVGKTTLSATLAYRAAQAGRSVALITIDPAKRLADALGLDALDDELREVEVAGAGRLQATMLDPGKTFERVVRDEATDTAHAERILASPLAEQLTNSLSGMTEYMAVERLGQLHNDPSIDLVVVDTPPSSDALAFLDAPNLLARLLDNRIYKVLVDGNKKGSNKKGIVNRALGGIVGQLVATVGGAVVSDAVDFFKSFEGIEDGFRARGDVMYETLRSDQTNFLLVATPTGASLTNARDFITQLSNAGVEPALTIANRCTPEVPKAGRSKVAAAIVDHLRTKRTAERLNIAAYAKDSNKPMVFVEDLPEPVTSLDGVQALAQQLR